MIKVLIADDEKRIRDGLAETIPWAALGMQVVGTAAHGEAALELARTHRPQIILTDVRMPRMDGLAFLKQARAFLPDAKVVILSGYDDFAYAQQAVKLGVSDYLVKPVGAAEIRSTLEALAASLRDDAGRLVPPEGGRFQPDGPRWTEAIRQGDTTGAFLALGEWRRRTGPAADVAVARQQALALVDEVIQDLRRHGFEFREGEASVPAQAFSSVLSAAEIEAVDAWLETQIEALTAFVRRNDRDNHRLILRRALECIEAGYSGDLTAEQVARAVGLTPNYFSHLFKKVRGQGFKEHLNALRVAKAQALLAAGGYKVYQVAQMVGFSDYKYFSAVFKKITGTSPTRPPSLGR